MKNYLFTLFTRFFVAFSGLIVFVVTAKLYGAEGRGLIGYGTSVVSALSLFFSFNLGRSFLFEYSKNKNEGTKYLSGFLSIHYLLFFVTISISALFFYLDIDTKIFIDFKKSLAFLILVPFYIWSVNGGAIYAALNRTPKQDFIIFITRIFLISIAFLFFIFNIHNISFFIFAYALVLSAGVITEMGVLNSPLKTFSQVYDIGRYISNAKYFHLDYLAFNLYPLILMIFAGSFLELYELGRLNFLLQLINFIFILSVVASLRMKTYVATKGTHNYLSSIKKIIFFTLFLSVIMIFALSFFLRTNFFNEHFLDFSDLSIYFLLVSLAVPGFLLYQFIYPVLIEYDLIRLSMKFNLLIFAILTALTYPILNLYGFLGSILLFVLFYFLVFSTQLYIYKKLKLTLIKN